MLNVATTVALIMWIVGMAMMTAAVIFRTMKRLLRISDEAIRDPQFGGATHRA